MPRGSGVIKNIYSQRGEEWYTSERQKNENWCCKYQKNKSYLDKLDSILSALEPLTIPDILLKKIVLFNRTNISIPLLSLFNLGEENFNILRNILNKRVVGVHYLFRSNFSSKPYKIQMMLVFCTDYCSSLL